MPLEPNKPRGNLRNSFYAYKFKSAQSRPFTHQVSIGMEPIHSTASPSLTNQFLVNPRPSTSKIVNNFLHSKTEAMKKGSFSPQIASPDKMSKRASSMERGYSSKKPEIHFENIVSDMNDYFSMMRHSALVLDLAHRRRAASQNTVEFPPIKNMLTLMMRQLSIGM